LEDQKARRLNVSLAYLTVIAIWSTTPLAIRVSALDTGFAFALMVRMAIGVVLAFTIIAVWRIQFPLHSRARRSYLIGGLGMFGGMLCTYWGALYVHSGLISVLFGLSPLVTSVLAVRWLNEPPLNLRKLAGMLLALAGLAGIFLSGHEISGFQAVMGTAVLLLGMLIYSATLVALKRINDTSPPLATTAGTLIVAMPLFILAWWLADGQIPAEISFWGGAAIVYLGVFGSVLGFALYYFVIKHMEAGKVALITLVTPVMALLLGNFLNGETVTMRVWLGAGLITLGLVVHQITVLVELIRQPSPKCS
jgi:drug/metabolite transporter (DMT)-like permease